MSTSKRRTVEGLINEIFLFEHAFRELLNAQTRELGLTTSQFKVLKAINEHGEMRHLDLTAKTLITKGTLTGVVDRLERAGLVSRRTHEKDKRALVVSLTEKGKESFKKMNRDYRAMLVKVFDTQDEDLLKQHRQNIAHLLEVISEGLAQVEPKAR